MSSARRHVSLGNPGWRSVALLLALALAGVHALDIPESADGLPCAASGYCSLGKVQPWTGDIRTSAALKACLATRSYQKELILLTETRLNSAFQTFAGLLSLGYEHVVLLSLPEPCSAGQAVWPRLACAYSSQTFVSTTKYLLDRVVFLVRAARLGTNVLMLDSDVIPQADLYTHLKAPHMRSTTLATMRDGNGWVNCGVVYAQNVAPDGPTAYVLAEVVDRLERWAEGASFLSSHGNPAHCWDQQMYSDTVLSALAGRPISYGCWYRHGGAGRAAWDVAHQRVFGTQETGPLENQHYLEGGSLPWPAELTAPNYPYKRSEVWTGEMHVPNTRGEWPAELGGQMYPPERGPSSKAFIELLKSDGLPMWPDPEDPKQAEAGAARMEMFAFLPQWMAESWSQAGSLGYWYPGLRGGAGGGPTAALAHMVHVPGGASNKLTAKMASANWDWDIAHAASRAPPKQGGSGPFFASKSATPLPDVLSYSAEVEGRAWASEAEFAAATLALLRLAMEMGRAAAFPAPRCNLTWMVMGADAASGNNRLPLAVNHGVMIPYSPPGRGFSDLRCLWGGYLLQGCQAVRWYFSGGLLAPEYDHLIDLLHQEGEAAAAAAAAQQGPQAAAAARAAKLSRWGFAAGAAGGSLRDTLRNTTGSSARAVRVPVEMLQPPAGAAAWDVKDLAAKLMAAYGGRGSGLLRSPAAALAAMNAAGNSTADVGTSGGSSSASSERPLVLELSEVPKLTEAIGERHAIFKRNLETGDDRHRFSCEWVRTGRPYRRRRRLQRRSSSRRRGR